MTLTAISLQPGSAEDHRGRPPVQLRRPNARPRCHSSPPEAIRRILVYLGLPSRPPPIAPAAPENVGGLEVYLSGRQHRPEHSDQGEGEMHGKLVLGAALLASKRWAAFAQAMSNTRPTRQISPYRGEAY